MSHSPHSTRRLVYYAVTGLHDARRALAPLLAKVLIVAGICLPILLLLGLKRGLIARFRADLLKSPTARQISAWAIAEGRDGDTRFSASLEDEIESQPGVALVIPDIPANGWLRLADVAAPKPASSDAAPAAAAPAPAPDAAAPATPTVEVSLTATKPGDPFLAFYGAELARPQAHDADQAKANAPHPVVITTALADALGLPHRRVGENRLQLTRPTRLVLDVKRAGEATRYPIPLIAHAVYPGDTRSAHLPRILMDQLEDFKKGRSVASLNLPGSPRPPTPQFDGYLAFAKTPYTSIDESRLRLRGLKATPLAEVDQPDAAQQRVLFGLLRPHDLQVYWLSAEYAATAGAGLVQLDPDDVADITDSDDAVMAWTQPAVLDVDGRRHRVVGVTVSGRWFRRYFHDYSTRLRAGDGLLRVMLPWEAPPTPPPDGSAASDTTGAPGESPSPPSGAPPPRTVAVMLPAADGRPVALEVAPLPADAVIPAQPAPRSADHETDSAASPPPPAPLPVAVVSDALAAYIARAAEGRLVFDPLLKQYVPVPEENRYTQARVYATDLDAVPAVDSLLIQMGYTTTSSKTRVLEIQNYAGTLSVLVWTVLAGVLLFGIVTVVVVFWDVTNRKRGAIGIMRVMGMPSVGILIIVLVRAMVVGVLAAGATMILGTALAWALTAVWNADCRILPIDALYITAGALLCSILGVLYPALHAAFVLDPVDAIFGSKVQ